MNDVLNILVPLNKCTSLTYDFKSLIPMKISKYANNNKYQLISIGTSLSVTKLQVCM